MLKQTTLKLAGSILVSILLGAVVSIIIIFTFGGIGSQSTSETASSSGSVSSSSSISSSQSSSSASSDSSLTSSTAISTSSQAAVTYSEGGLIDSIPGKILLGGLSILIIFAMVYNTAWKEGNKDPNRVHYGHMKKFMAKGLVAGLLAIIPFFIYTIVFLIINSTMNGTITATTIGAIYRALNMEFIVFGDGWLKYPAVCFLILLMYPLISTIGYLAGYRGIVIWTKVIYKGKNTKRKQKYLNNLKK